MVRWFTEDALEDTTVLHNCESSPCQNGGTCHDDIGLFTCSCPIGYEGNVCQIGKYFFVWIQDRNYKQDR